MVSSSPRPINSWTRRPNCARFQAVLARLFMFNKKLLVLDLETTGLDPRADSIIQIGAHVLTRKVLNREATMSTLVAPESAMDPAAQKIHGLSMDDLRDAPPLAEAIRKLEELAEPEDVVLCGHNIGFDVSFLRAAYDRLGRPYPYDYHTVDVWSVAFFLFSANGLKAPDYRLDTLAALYGIERSRKHDALEDVQITTAILRHLYRSALESSLKLSGQEQLFAEEGTE